MLFEVDESTRRLAKTPHELAMVNLLLFNLLMLIALLAGSFLPQGSPLADYKLVGVLVPLAISLGIVAYSFRRAASLTASGPWFAAIHWRLATGRYKILLIAYAAGIGLIGLGWLLSLLQRTPGMQQLMFVALERVAVAPILVSLMVLIMLESGALYQAGRGEVPDSLVKRFPPPPDLRPLDAQAVPGSD